MREHLVLVDEFGFRTGTADRHECHTGEGIRHLAFVVFLFDKQARLLVQKRNHHKLGGNLWDVSATSHVRSNETYATAIQRCLSHELGIDATLRPEYLLSYTYLETLGAWAENEFCSLFCTAYEGAIKANPQELDEYHWISFKALTNWYCADRGRFTRWFGEAFERLRRHPVLHDPNSLDFSRGPAASVV
jgi:isopentenyl-diphosphate delta-isomerase